MARKTYTDFLPENKVVTKQIKGIMVRPDNLILDWLSKLSVKHNVSVNKLVLAFIEAEFARAETGERG